MKIKTVCLFGLFLILSVKNFAFNIGVYPTGFKTSLEKPVTEQIKLFNNTNKAVRVNVSVAKPDEIKKDKYMGEWIKIYPKIVTLPPNGERTVRFSIKKPENISKGEYRSYLVFTELEKNAAETVKMIEDPNADGPTVNVEFTTELYINIFGEL